MLNHSYRYRVNDRLPNMTKRAPKVQVILKQIVTLLDIEGNYKVTDIRNKVTKRHGLSKFYFANTVDGGLIRVTSNDSKNLNGGDIWIHRS